MARGKKSSQVQPEHQKDNNNAAEVRKENDGKSYVHYCSFVLSNC